METLPLTSVRPNDLPRLHFQKPLTHEFEDDFSIKWIWGWHMQTIARIFKTLLKHNLVSPSSSQLENILSAQIRKRLITNLAMCSRTSAFHSICLQRVQVQFSCKIIPDWTNIFTSHATTRLSMKGSFQWEDVPSAEPSVRLINQLQLQSISRGCSVAGPES